MSAEAPSTKPKSKFARKPRVAPVNPEHVRLGEMLFQYATQCKEAGLGPEQITNLVKAGIFLHPKQLIFAAACRSCDKDNGPTAIGFGGTRGPGKSHAVLSQIGADDCQRFPGLKVLYLRKVGKSNKEQFDDYRKKLFGQLPHEYADYKGKLTFANGSMIIVGHFQNEKDIDAYLGLEYDLIAIEEATTLTQTKYKNIETCLRSSKPGWRPRMYLSTNPGNVGHQWFKEKFVMPFRIGTEKLTRFIPATLADNPTVNKEYAAAMESLPSYQRKIWYEGDWDVSAGQFFTNWREDVHVLEKMDESRAKRWFAALDFGVTHYTVCLLGYSDEDNNICIVDEHARRGMLIEDHAFHIKSMMSLHNVTPYELEYFAAGKDCFSIKPDLRTISDDYALAGIQLVPAEVDRQNGWAEVMKRLGSPEGGIKPTLYIHRRCTLLIATMPILQHSEIKPEDVEKVDCDDKGNGGDDAADCLRYLLATNPISCVGWAKAVNMGGWDNIRNGDAIDAQWQVV